MIVKVIYCHRFTSMLTRPEIGQFHCHADMGLWVFTIIVTDSGQPLYTRTKRSLRQTTRRDPLQYGILIILFVVFSYDHVLSVLLAVIHARVGNLYDVFRSFICLIVFLETDRYRNENVLSEK